MSFAQVATYCITFLALYVQVFFFVTFLEKRHQLKKTSSRKTIGRYSSVAIIVPCWNEEKTVHKTVGSLLALDYPKDKLEVIIVDDGSTDSTWNEILQYENHPQIKIFQKENGGKHTAMNLGIDQTNAEFIGCLDADSFVTAHALKDMMMMFESKPETMAIAPTLIVEKPEGILQWAQRVEYNMSVYLKKMQAFLNAIHVTPGPFSIFRREVFERIGKFKKAHNTEDQEIAYRMQQHHMKIDHCHTAYVYTVAPDTIKKLFRQRLRWIYGFIQNTFDYRHLIFRKKYGNFSLFTLPAGAISIAATMYLFFAAAYNLTIHAIEKIAQMRIIGTSSFFSDFKFDLFYVNTQTMVFVTAMLYVLVIVAVILGTKMAKQKLNGHIFTFVIIYSVLAPFWLMKAIWNSVIAKKPSWR